MDCSTPGFPVHHQLPEFTQTHIHRVGDAIQSSHPLLLQPSVFPSIRVFSSESVLCIRWPKYWSCSFSISPSNEYSGFISFRIDWLDLLAVQGTLKSLLQHHSSKASILWRSLSHFLLNSLFVVIHLLAASSFFFFLVFILFGCTRSGLPHVGSSSLTRDRVQAPTLGAQSLGH